MKNPTIYNWDKLPVVLTVKDLALIFGVSDVTIKHLIYAGEIQGYKLGRQWRFDREYIRRLCEVEREAV